MKRIIKTVKEELMLLNKKTDMMPFILDHVMINDIDEDDEDYEEEYTPLGIVSIILAGMIVIPLMGLLSMAIVML